NQPPDQGTRRADPGRLDRLDGHHRLRKLAGDRNPRDHRFAGRGVRMKDMSAQFYGRPSTTLRRRFGAVAATLVAILGFTASATARQAAEGDVLGLSPTQLRVEALTNPLGIEVKEPRLSWIVVSSIRGEHQTAYQILVADD